MDQKKYTLTRECIFTALLMLMEQKPYEEISITEIARKAGVSRMSYYRMFKSKDDILIQSFNDIFEKCLEEIREQKVMDRSQFAVLIFEVVREHHQLVECVFHAKLYDLVFQCMIRYCTYLAEHILHRDVSDSDVDYRIYEEAGRVCLLIYRWVERGMEESPEKMAEYLIQNPF